MKARLLVVLLSIVAVVPSIVCFAQTSPNLENGFKAFGSYDSSHLDTVNLMNGNVMLHVPLLPAYPQRGSIIPQYTLYMTSKAWQVQTKMVSDPNLGTFPAYYWNSPAPGVMITSNTGVLMGRDLFESFSGTGQSIYSSGDYTITGPDASVHHLNAIPGYPAAPDGDPTAYESVDGSGYRLVTSKPDLNGVMSTATVIDRNGVQFQGNFSTDFSKCGRPATVTLPSPGNYPAVQDDTAFGDHTCHQFAYSQSAIDSNGNQIGFVSTGEQTPPIPTTDTLGRSMPFAFVPAAPATADPAKCVVPSNGTFYESDLLYYNAPDGSTRYIQRCYATMPIQTSFGLTVGGSTVAEAPSINSFSAGTTPLLVTLIQADGTKWTFNYDSYANLTFIGLPTGGSISYSWTMIHLITCSPDLTSIGRAVEYRIVTDNNGHSTQWHYTWGSPGTTLTNTVRDPAGNDTVHVFTEIGCSYYEKSTQYYQGPQAGKPIKQVDTTYSPNTIPDDSGHAGNVVPISIQTTINPSGLVSLITKTYDTGYGPGTPIFADVVQEKDYDWGQGQPGPLLRETDTVYKWQKDSSYLAAHLVDLPASTIVISPDAAANTRSGCPLTATTSASCMAETDYSYDEPITGYLVTPTPAVTTQHVAPPGGVRGNQTTVSRWLSTTGEMVSSHTLWYDTGEPYQKLDLLGHITTLSYDPAYVGAYVTQTCSPQTGTVTHCVSGTYEMNTGALASLTDENGQTSNYAYDYMFHLTSAEAPPDPGNGNARATTSFSYSDITVPGSFPVSITRTRPVTNGLTDSATNTFDGLARLITSTHAMPSGTPSTVTTTYDDNHATVSVTNPYFTNADPTYGSTATQSDALGRPLTVTEQDGSVKGISYSVVSLTGSTGDYNVTVDEAGHQRRACSDALGRLVEVDEPNPASVDVSAQATLSFSGSLGVRNGVGSHSATQSTGTITVTGTAPAPVTVCNPDITPTANNPCPGAQTISDHGTVTLTVGGHADSVNYSANEGSGSVALALQSTINADAGALIHVNSVSGGSLIVQSVAAGSGTNYSWTISSQSLDTTGTFGPGPGPFSGGPGGLSGGTDAYAGITVYDKGTLTLTVGGFSGQVCYGTSSDCAAPPPQCPTGDSTALQVACIAASALNSAASPVSATYSGTASLTITDKTAGRGGNGLAVTVTPVSTQTLTTFSPPSFSSAGTTLGLGLNAGDVDNQPFVTLYSYDALGDLLCVEQHGSVAGTGCSASPASDATSPWRVRRFTYDSLGRLLTAHNPESGTITYSYDADGNLLQKTSPAPNQTGAVTQTISYCYDALNRVTGKAYSGQSCPLSSPTVTYTYDSGANGKGKLTGVTDQAGSGSYSYDSLGRLASETRVINGISKSLSYDYNLDSSVKALHYPSGAVVTYTPDSAGRFTSAVDTANGINYVTSAAYQADGQMTGFVSGNSGTFAGITSAFSYNKRLQPVNMSANAPSQTVFSIGYDFHVGNGTTGSDNGNVWGITNYKDQTRNQTFAYDLLNRLTSAQNAGTNCAAATVNGKTEYWGNSYGYDSWGNLVGKSVTKCSAENLSLTALANNQLSGYGYDAAGNMTSDPTDSVTSTYDSENRIATASTPQGVFTYTYDADGNRVEKSGGGTGTLYWYMSPGIIGESDLSGTMKSEYVFFNGERVARRDLVTPGGVFYYFSDHLKTASVITDSAGNIKSESDYYPWGGELQFVNNDSNHYKFTGKERDSESGLDYFGARYYSNGLGRFITPDWAAKASAVPYAEFADPQSLNLYSYVRDVPTSKADTNGHCAEAITCSAEAGAIIGTAVEPGGGTAVGATVGMVVGAAIDVGLGGYLLYTHYFKKAVPGSRPGKDFTKSGKKEIDAKNADGNGGKNRCTKCGKEVKRRPNTKGEPTTDDQLQRHHVNPKSKGGSGTPENGEVVCPACHQEIHNPSSGQAPQSPATGNTATSGYSVAPDVNRAAPHQEK